MLKDTVYEIVKKIPKGKVATYKQIAKLAGKPRAYRAVGSCLRKNHEPKTVPCHRVVGSGGKLAGYAFGNGITTKKEILLKEGVIFKGKLVDLAKSGWRK
jgi:O-6-methylguanine DNA methyltransferase